MLKKVFEMLISNDIRQDPLRYSYAKNMVGVLLIALVAAPFYALIYYLLGFTDAALIIVLEGLMVFLAILFLKMKGSLSWARQIIVASLFICLALLTIRLGGIYTPVTFWLILIPLIIVFFGGKKSSVFWSLICIVFVLIAYMIPSLVITPEKISHLMILQAISITGLILIMHALAYFFEYGKRDALQQMHDAHEQLKSAKIEQASLHRIAEANALLTNILESSIEYSIIATDMDEKILTWNAGAKNNYGYEADEMIGIKTMQELLSPKDIATHAHENFVNVVKSKGRGSEIFERKRKNGELFLAEVDMSLRTDNNNNAVGFLVISKDITEKKRLEEQLLLNKELDEQNRHFHEVNRLKSAFLANMSHELRTPLTAILGFSELMRVGELGPTTEEQRAALNDIVDSGKDLLRLIDGLLDLSKIELGKLDFKPELFYLPFIVNSVMGLMRPLFNEKKIAYTVEIDKTLSEVYNDPARLRQILFNYLSNAIKFTPVHGKVNISIKDQGKMFCIEVKDSGIGIAEADISKLFVEFQQLDSSATKKYSGTGLGLALIKHIVEAQGGKIGVISHLGEGSTFYAKLPKHLSASEESKREFLKHN